MTNPPPPTAPSLRPVLLWKPESEETRVEPGIEQAAEFLEASTEGVLTAIGTGDLLKGWFVDWQVAQPSPSR